MPMFRVTGDYRVAFIHTVEADSAEDAEDKVARLGVSQFDTTDSGEVETDDCVELDEDGNEIEGSGGTAPLGDYPPSVPDEITLELIQRVLEVANEVGPLPEWARTSAGAEDVLRRIQDEASLRLRCEIQGD